jgi:hypothetical protein
VCLFDLAVYRVLPHDRVVFFQFDAFRRVLAVLLCDVPRRAGQTAIFVLGALEDDLEPVAFAFLCHCI